jgi:hypothetical protein
MQNHIKVIERVFIFSERPFDFLVELCGYSNAVATAHRLSREQQKMLILHFIPTTSPIHKMIKTLPTLEAIFHYASTSSTIILTRADLEKQLDSWKLDTSSYNNLNMSLAVLKSLLMDINPGKFKMRNRSQLYIAMARQINRQKLTPWVYRSMEEVILKLEQENDESEMYSMILAVVKGLIKNTHFVPITHGIDSASSSFDGLNLKATTSKSTGTGTKPKQKAKKTKKEKSSSSEPTPARSPSSSRFRIVAKWPLDKTYLNKSGNALTKECEKHFLGFCYECGYGNHTADACRIYDSKLVLTSCEICQRGFHDQCRNKYALENKSGNNSKDKRRSNQANQVNQILDGFSSIMNKHVQQHPVYPVVPMPMGMGQIPYYPQHMQLQKQHFADADNVD